MLARFDEDRKVGRRRKIGDGSTTYPLLVFIYRRTTWPSPPSRFARTAIGALAVSSTSTFEAL